MHTRRVARGAAAAASWLKVLLWTGVLVLLVVCPAGSARAGRHGGDGHGHGHGRPGGPRCDRLVFPVALAPGDPADLNVVAWLCSDGPIRHKTIQVLVHGATYDHNIWDFPYRPEHYSYVRAATAAGYATLNMDRLGHGQSSLVPGDSLDLIAGAFAIHQMIGALRSGTVVSPSFGRINARRILLGGESIAGNIVWFEAGTYHDVDGLLVAGSAHTFSIGLQRIQENTIPVEDDPRLSRFSYPPGYFTTAPGTRGSLFYHLPDASRAVIAIDELLKDTITSGENNGVFPTLAVSQQVDVPTLITIGDFDDLFCDPPSCTASGTIDNETDSYGPGSCAELLIMPHAGHVLNLHRNAPVYFEAVREWADRRVGADDRALPPDPCDE